MKHLFICENFSGAIIPVIHWLASQPGNQVLLASDRLKYPVGIQKILLKRTPVKNPPSSRLDYAAHFIQRAKNAGRSFESLRESGFYPDNVFIFANSAVSLALEDSFPNARRIIFLEPEARSDPSRAAAYKDLRDQLILSSDYAFSFSKKLKDALPSLLKEHVRAVSPCADPDFYPQASEKRLSVFYLKEHCDLDKWLDRALERAKSHDTAVLLPTYQDLKDCREKMRGEAAGARIWLGCDPSLDTARRVFSQCDLFISPDSELSYYTLAAMSCGACVIAAASHERLKAGVNYLPLETDKIADVAREAKREIGARGRRTVIENFNAAKIVPEILKDILEA